jgi:hypothetical protein
VPITRTRLRRMCYFISRECNYFSIVQTYRFGSNPNNSESASQSFRFSVKIFSRYALTGGPEKISPPGPEHAVGGPALATSSFLGSNTVLTPSSQIPSVSALPLRSDKISHLHQTTSRAGYRNGVATRPRADRPVYEFRQGQEIFLFSKTSRSTQPPIQWVPGFFLGGEVAGRDVNHSPPPNAEVRMSCTSTSPRAFLARTGTSLLSLHRAS